MNQGPCPPGQTSVIPKPIIFSPAGGDRQTSTKERTLGSLSCRLCCSDRPPAPEWNDPMLSPGVSGEQEGRPLWGEARVSTSFPIQFRRVNAMASYWRRVTHPSRNTWGQFFQPISDQKNSLINPGLPKPKQKCVSLQKVWKQSWVINYTSWVPLSFQLYS